MESCVGKKLKIDWREISLLSLILFLTFLIRVPFLAEPFESDQTMFAYIAQNWRQGKIPYHDFWDNKPPNIYIFERFILNLFGLSVEKIHLAFAILALFSTFIFYLFSRRLFTRGSALLSAFLYGLFSGGALISGSFANSENLMVFFSILAFYIFYKANQRKANFLFSLTGIFMGLAMMSKQVAFWEAIAMSLFLFWQGFRQSRISLALKKIALIWLGAGLVIILFFVYFMVKGAGKDFFDSVFLYNLFFGRIVGIRYWLIKIFSRTFAWTPRENFLIWILAGLGLWKAAHNRDDKSILMILWFGAAFLGIISTLRFYYHYFIQIIPPLILLATFYLSEMLENKTVLWKRYAGIVLVILTMVFFFRIQWRYYFYYQPVDSLIYRRRLLARPLLYKAAPQMAAFIKQNTKPDDYIYIWGLWPEIYFYSQRQSSSKYFYLSGEGTMIGEFANSVHQQVLYDTIRNKPKYFIIDYRFADLISAPLEKYLKENYSLDTKIAGCQVLRRNEPEP